MRGDRALWAGTRERATAMTDHLRVASRDRRRRRGRASLVAVKAVHTVVWLAVESSMLYLLVAGFTRRADRGAAIAGAIVAGESLMFAASGCRCPLTGVAESLGAEHGSVTDMLPAVLVREESSGYPRAAHRSGRFPSCPEPAQPKDLSIAGPSHSGGAVPVVRAAGFPCRPPLD